MIRIGLPHEKEASLRINEHTYSQQVLQNQQIFGSTTQYVVLSVDYSGK